MIGVLLLECIRCVTPDWIQLDLSISMTEAVRGLTTAFVIIRDQCVQWTGRVYGQFLSDCFLVVFL